jgi:hypothetical protein
MYKGLRRNYYHVPVHEVQDPCIVLLIPRMSETVFISTIVLVTRINDTVPISSSLDLTQEAWQDRYRLAAQTDPCCSSVSAMP